MSLDTKSFGLAGGILWSTGMVLMTILALTIAYGTSFLNMMAAVYPGYNVSGLGILVGGIYGFIDGFICTYLFAWLYNKLERKK